MLFINNKSPHKFQLPIERWNINKIGTMNRISRRLYNFVHFAYDCQLKQFKSYVLYYFFKGNSRMVNCLKLLILVL